MRLVTFGILAVSLCAGCAVQAGDPGSTDEAAVMEPGASAQQPAGKTAAPAKGLQAPSSTASPVNWGNPDPSPWNPPVQIPAWSGSGNAGGATGSTADEGNLKGPRAPGSALQRTPEPEPAVEQP